jgi:hypothetical protein
MIRSVLGMTAMVVSVVAVAGENVKRLRNGDRGRTAAKSLNLLAERAFVTVMTGGSASKAVAWTAWKVLRLHPDMEDGGIPIGGYGKICRGWIQIQPRWDGPRMVELCQFCGAVRGYGPSELQELREAERLSNDTCPMLVVMES